MVSMLTKRPLTLLLLLGLSAPGWAASSFFCCNDPSSGRRVCGDSLPQQCRGQAYRIFDKAGNLQKEVGPPLTAEQKAVQKQQAELAKRQEEAAREQRRLDQALLDTYATPEDIDRAQGKAESDILHLIKAAQDKILAAEKEQKKLAAEAEFYPNKAKPADLEKKLHNSESEIKMQQELIDVKNRDLVTLRTKYDTERQRYFELTGRSSGAASAASTTATSAAASTTPKASPSTSR